ncbi:uncharacterized protein Dmoj_GI21700 [Drosophila mojavensis]|uniref:Uncharacterized protein n=1 Tax=Drosophila mojavensis TaxID=7230 RepID=B4L5C2_DROMO|nr:uncharacterized protein Dmoj_GI21700 [Drosophila mojavensis]
MCPKRRDEEQRPLLYLLRLPHPRWVGVEVKGAVYYYDPIGSYERVRYRVVGTSYALLLPCLDVFYGWENNRLTPPLKDEDLTMTMAVRMARKCLYIASDRDIYSGDMGELLSVTSEGMKSSTIKLRAD